MFKPLLRAIQMHIRTKLVLGYVGATVITLILTMLSVSITNIVAFTNEFASTEALKDGVRAYTPALTALVSTERDEYDGTIQKTLDAVRKEQQSNLPNGLKLDLQLIFIDKDKEVVASSPPTAFPKVATNALERTDSGSGAKTTFSQGFLYKTTETIVQVHDFEGIYKGNLVIRATGSLGPAFLREGALTFLPLACTVLVVGLLIAYGVGKIVSNHLLRRLESVFEALEEWRSGRFQKLAPIVPRDELGLLGLKLNDLARALETLLSERGKRAQILERERVERDLHDTVKQQTFAASLQLAIALKQLERGEDARPVIEQARSLMESARKDLAEMFTATDHLPTRISLSDAVAGRGKVWMEGANMNLTVEVNQDLGISETLIPDLLRIVDEALANVVRHSRANHVSLFLKREGSSGVLTIVDDGIGFQPTLIESGRGLKNIRDRAAVLPGGRCQITSAPRSGTTVQVEWDLDER